MIALGLGIDIGSWGVASGFNYASIPNCALWLQGDLGVTGSPVNTWADQSGNGNNATATLGRRPTTSTSINGKPCISFDGSLNCLTLPTFASTGAKTIIVVRKLTTVPPGSGWYTLLSLKDPTPSFSDVNALNTGGYQNESVLADFTGAVPSVGFNPTLNTSPHRLVATYNGAGASTPSNYTESYDGSAQTVVASGLMGRSTTDLASIGARQDNALGVSFQAAVDFALILVYTRVLTGGELTTIGTNTVAMWGV